ncbi:hypothetical protein SDRG_07944 [Saprolegnia diclina VS20]|uniref:Uncharacterized protein n=1 Tax=Saprolegnia diclina (strain VS20) TaxID=1156394 RepID=T0RWB2_SAPDV|nr:hypothetical protein SDRG_07944 [Saprolegnia diclina VS20]EQC34622.1 hypothetical protein SDRG_07944 [Saprolegnia diclina VS20]|eukprot:XP_008612028.1 hypothetical protein SDRG_07944 [Saprolegnia diclina VS20]
MQGLSVSTTRKLFACQLVACQAIPESRSKYTYRGVDLTRAWVQGVIVATEASPQRIALDDGTGIIWVHVENVLKNTRSLSLPIGAYVMVIGPPTGREMLQAHQVMPLSVGREALWWLEVAEYWHLLVPPVIELE